MPASFKTFGIGCSGTVGVPSLAAAPGELPLIGQPFEIQFSGMPTSVANAPFGILGLSKTNWDQFSLPRDLSMFGLTNCTQFVSLGFTAALVNNGGTATWDIPIPNNPFLIGLPIYVQGAVIDFAVDPANIILTNAGEGVIGGW